LISILGQKNPNHVLSPILILPSGNKIQQYNELCGRRDVDRTNSRRVGESVNVSDTERTNLRVRSLRERE
jgi:hypothetical protein